MNYDNAHDLANGLIPSEREGSAVKRWLLAPAPALLHKRDQVGDRWIIHRVGRDEVSSHISCFDRQTITAPVGNGRH